MIGIQRGLIENVYLPFQLNKMIVSDDESWRIIIWNIWLMMSEIYTYTYADVK
jgi:hypothetical protein